MSRAPARVVRWTGAEPPPDLLRRWGELWRRCPEATVFQHPAWLVPWARTFASAIATGGVALAVGERLVGLAPLVRDAGGVRLQGGGISDYLDGLAEPGWAGPLLAAVLRQSAATVELAQLPPGGALAGAPLPRGWAETSADQDACPAVAPAAVPAGMRRRLGYERRRLARLGGSVERTTADALAEHVEAFFATHAARWAARGEAGVLADVGVRNFHRSAAPGLHAEGLLRLYVLRLGGAVQAAAWLLAGGGWAGYYLGGFEPAVARLGPGALLVGAAVDDHAAAGGTVFDFLRGQEPYKYRWGAVDRLTRRRRLVRT